MEYLVISKGMPFVFISANLITLPVSSICDTLYGENLSRCFSKARVKGVYTLF